MAKINLDANDEYLHNPPQRLEYSNYKEVVEVKHMRHENRTGLLRGQYAMKLIPSIVAGSVLATLALIALAKGPIQSEWINRFCFGHWSTVVSIYLCTISLIGLALKWYSTLVQSRLVLRSNSAMKRLLVEGREIEIAAREDWLLESWRAQPEPIASSWFGANLRQLLSSKVRQGQAGNLIHESNSLSELTNYELQQSYSILRFSHGAILALGLLGAIVCISNTLSVASTEQQASATLLAGLARSLDSIAVAIVLTTTSLATSFLVRLREQQLSTQICILIEDGLQEFLSSTQDDVRDSLLSPVRDMTTDLVNCVRELVVEQAAVWSGSINESQRQWTEWTHKLADEVDLHLVAALGDAMSKHLIGLETVQERVGRQFETRLQQWQTTLSEQTRVLHQQQKEMIQQTSALQQLIQSTADLKKLEDAICTNLRTIEEVGTFDKAADRINAATQCVVEAVAMLATSLERAGLVRSTPQRPRVARKSTTDSTAESSENPVTIPINSTVHEETDQPASRSVAVESHQLDQRGKAA